MEKKLYGTVLLKAQKILDYIACAKGAPTLGELSDHLEISKPTIYKILTTLAYCGYVKATTAGNEKVYHLGTIFLRYAQAVNDSLDITAIAKPYLTELRDKTAETVNLGIDDEGSIVLLAKMESTNSIKLVSVIGGKMHMYSSAMGKAILAAYPPRELKDYLAQVEFQRLTPNTITDKQALMKDLEKIRQQGYAIDNVENQAGVYCIGFSIVANGKIYGAFSISIPEYRLTEEKREQFIALGKRTREKIIAKL